MIFSQVNPMLCIGGCQFGQGERAEEEKDPGARNRTQRTQKSLNGVKQDASNERKQLKGHGSFEA